MLVQTARPTRRRSRPPPRHDADGFLAGELERRRALRYPPFADLIRVVCSAADAGAAPAPPPAHDRGAPIDAPETELLGPAPLFRLRDRERFQLVLKTTARAPTRSPPPAPRSRPPPRDKTFRDVNFSVDVDPV